MWHEHAGAITSVTFNAEKTLLVTSSADRSSKLWDVEKMRVLRTCVGRRGPAGREGRGCCVPRAPPLPARPACSYLADVPVNAAALAPNREILIMGGGQEARDVTTTSTSAGEARPPRPLPPRCPAPFTAPPRAPLPRAQASSRRASTRSSSRLSWAASRATSGPSTRSPSTRTAAPSPRAPRTATSASTRSTPPSTRPSATRRSSTTRAWRLRCETGRLSRCWPRRRRRAGGQTPPRRGRLRPWRRGG